MIITIPFKTPTVNHLYWHRGNCKVMKKEAKKLRDEIAEIVFSSITPQEKEVLLNRKLAVTIEIHEDWYCKNNTIKKKDIANREKFLIDSVFNALDIDDRFIFIHQMIKKQCDENERAIVTIEVL